jgi:hypothetical protein
MVFDRVPKYGYSVTPNRAIFRFGTGVGIVAYERLSVLCQVYYCTVKERLLESFTTRYRFDNYRNIR